MDYFDKMFDPNAPLPKRTGQTNLTDDELLLFDFLFDSRIRFKALIRDAYLFNMNVRYTHNLEVAELQKALDALITRGLLATQKSGEPHQDIVYSLTPEGGQLWEMERLPDWDRFCSSTHLEAGLVVTAPRFETADAFVHVWNECSDDAFDLTRMRYVQRTNEWLLSWKVFPEVNELHVPYADPSLDRGRLRDWDYYEEQRRWWRFIKELDTMKR